MMNDPIFEQLVRRIEGDRQSLNEAAALLHAMTDRKAWRRMRWDNPANMDELSELIAEKKIFVRQVTLTDRWWTHCTGRMIGFLADDDTPVILRPGFTSYSFIHPKTKHYYRVNDSKTDTMLKRDAFVMCRPLPVGRAGTGPAPTAWQVVRHGLADLSLADGLYMLMACLSVVLLTMVTPYVSKLLFNEVVPSGDSSQIVPVVALLSSAGVGLIMVHLTRNLVVMRLKDKVEYSVQTSLMHHLLALPTGFFKEYSSGDLTSRVLAVSRFSGMLSSDTLSTILTFLFSGVMFVQFFIYGGPLLWTGIAVLSFVLLTIWLQYYYLLKVRNEVSPGRSRLQGVVYSLANGLQKVKTCGAEIRAFRHWAYAYEPSDPYSSGKPTISFYASSISYGASFLPMFVTMWAAWHYGLGLSDYIAYVSVLTLAAGSLDNLQGVTGSLAMLKPEIALCLPIIKASTEAPGQHTDVEDISGAIDVRRLKFRYPSTSSDVPDENSPLLFDGLDLHINAGDYVALTGPSGCGKSSLLRLMIGFEEPLSGSIFYDQYNLNEIYRPSLRQNCLGICLQDSRLIEGTILDNILFNAPWLTEEDAWEAARMVALDKDINQMPNGMQTRLSANGQGVSGGQRQRIVLARAFVRKPKVLFLDEATSALDNISQSIVTESLAKMKCTRVVIAHRLSTIRQCNRIIYIRDGRVAADGTYDELAEKGYIQSEE